MTRQNLIIYHTNCHVIKELMKYSNLALISFKGELHPKLELSMFFSRLSTPFEKQYDYLEPNCMGNSKNGKKKLVGPAVLDLFIKTF